MEIKDIRASHTWDGDPVLSITLDKAENNAIDSLLHDMSIDMSQYELSIVKRKEKRSLSANNYAWVLMGKIAKELKLKTKMDVYRGYIRECGVFEIVPVREDAIARWVANWRSQGDGYVCEDMGECRNAKGYHYMRCYYGSHTYTKDEMSHLIELIVADCRELGIETMTPAELEKMKNAWEENRK